MKLNLNFIIKENIVFINFKNCEKGVSINKFLNIENSVTKIKYGFLKREIEKLEFIENFEKEINIKYFKDDIIINLDENFLLEIGEIDTDELLFNLKDVIDIMFEFSNNLKKFL